MPEIKAPYNFVPVTDKVFFPDWADKISHDIPFSDGESGQLELEIEAQSPLYIRNSKKKKRDGQEPVDFFNHQGEYYIPGSSLKGMIRNVVEIISYGKMKPAEDGRYSIREFGGNAYDLPSNARKVHGGFLVKENEKTRIVDCSIPARISHEEIDNAFNTDFCKAFQDHGDQTQGNGSTVVENAKSASFKYRELFQGGTLENYFEVLDKNRIDQDIVKPVFNGDGRAGIIVFTGQPNVRFRKPKSDLNGKFYEFVFWEPNETAKKIDVPDAMLDDFLFIYKNYDEANISPDWKFWKPKFNDGERVPVFFRLDKNGDLKDFGLSFMYKMPFKNSVHDLIPESHKSKDLDLAECIFGPATDKRDNPASQQLFKGRVQFSHAKPTNEVDVEEKVETVLGTPSASFYPFYLKQPQKGGSYKTYQDNDSSLAGWKRYPVHQKESSGNHGNANPKMISRFQPLKRGTKFISKVAFHNLKKAEIGALLSALTFHKTDGCYHSLGMAKSLGYGKVTIKVKDGESGLKYSLDDYLKAFEEVLEADGDLKVQDWSQHQAYCELMTMATEQPGRQMPLEHMELEDFEKVKQSKDPNELLGFYSTLDGINPKCPKSLMTEEDLKKMHFRGVDKIKEEKEKLDQELEEKERIRIEQEKEKRKAEDEARRRKTEELKNKGLGTEINENIPDEFKKVSGRVDTYLKKVGRLSDADIQNILYPKIKACFENEKMKPRTLKPWQGEINKSPVWKKVSSWIGAEKAAKWQEEIMGGENK